VICAFLASVAGRFGIVPACRALSGHGVQISPRTYHARRSRPASRRALRDAWLTGLLAAMFEPDERGRCTVERLMRASGWRGNTRARRARTTVPDPRDARAPDLVNRDFRASGPGRLLVADFTYSAQLAVMCGPTGDPRSAWCFPVGWLHIIRGLPEMRGAGRLAGIALAAGLGREIPGCR